MTDSTLVAYATKKGSTRDVALAIAELLDRQGLGVDVRAAADLETMDGYSGVVLGGALYMGRLHRDAREFLVRFREELAQVPTAVFAMGPGTLDDKDVRRSRAQLDRALSAVPEIDPVSVAIFGGVLDPAKLRFPFNHMPATDARDWDEIRSWANRVARAFACHHVALA
jgi:menaquinone-dependent protoporphyrinogen oxidase